MARIRLCMQFFEVDLPQVSQKKIDLVDAVIPDKQKVLLRVLFFVLISRVPKTDRQCWRCACRGCRRVCDAEVFTAQETPYGVLCL